MQFKKAIQSRDKEQKKNPNRTYENNILQKCDSIQKVEENIPQQSKKYFLDKNSQNKRKSKNQKNFTLQRIQKQSQKNFKLIKKRVEETQKKEKLKRKKELCKTPKQKSIILRKKIELQSAIYTTKKNKKRTDTLEKDFTIDEITQNKKKKLQKYMCKKKTKAKKEPKNLQDANFRFDYYYTKPLKNVLMINLSDREHKLSYQSNLRIQHIQQVFSKLKKINVLYQQYLINNQKQKDTLNGSISNRKEFIQKKESQKLFHSQIPKTQTSILRKIKLREDKKKKFTIFLDLDETLVFTSSKCSNKEAVRITSPYSNQEVQQKALCSQKATYGQIYQVFD